MRGNAFGRAAALCLAVVLALSLPVTSWAQGEGQALPTGEYPGDRPGTEPRATGSPPDMGGLGYVIAQIVRAFTGILAKALSFAGLESVESLVFNQGRKAEYTVGDAFTASERDGAVMRWYNAFRSLAMLPVLVTIIVTVVGVNMAVNPKALSQASETFLNLLVAAGLLAASPGLLKLFLELNSAIVSFLWAQITSSGAAGASTAASIMQALQQDPTVSPLVLSLVELNLAALTLYFNIIYLVRKVVLALMLMAVPLVVWAWVGRRTREPVLTAFSEMLTNSLMSASHAIVLAFFFTMLRFQGPGMLSAWWAKLVMLNMVIPLAAVLRRILIGWLSFLGVDEEKMAGWAAAGLGGIAGLASLAGTVGTSAGRVGASWLQSGYRTVTGNAAAQLEPGQHMVQGTLMAYNANAARIVNADKQGFDVPISRLPGNARIGDRFNLVLGPEDPNRQEPDVIKIRPASSGQAPGASSGGQVRGPARDFARSVAGVGKFVGTGFAFGTRAQQAIGDFGAGLAYHAGLNTALGAEALWPTVQPAAKKFVNFIMRDGPDEKRT